MTKQPDKITALYCRLSRDDEQDGMSGSPRTLTPITIYSATYWRKMPKLTPNIRETAATGLTGQCRTRTCLLYTSQAAEKLIAMDYDNLSIKETTIVG